MSRSNKDDGFMDRKEYQEDWRYRVYGSSQALGEARETAALVSVHRGAAIAIMQTIGYKKKDPIITGDRSFNYFVSNAIECEVLEDVSTPLVIAAKIEKGRYGIQRLMARIRDGEDPYMGAEVFNVLSPDLATQHATLKSGTSNTAYDIIEFGSMLTNMAYSAGVHLPATALYTDNRQQKL